jgi:hypothetical protein
MKHEDRCEIWSFHGGEDRSKSALWRRVASQRRRLQLWRRVALQCILLHHFTVSQLKRTKLNPRTKNVSLLIMRSFFEGRLKSSWTRLITPSRNFVEVRWRSLFRSTFLGKRCISYNAPPTSRKTCCRPLITSKFLASELPFHSWKSPEIAWGEIWTVWQMF